MKIIITTDDGQVVQTFTGHDLAPLLASGDLYALADDIERALHRAAMVEDANEVPGGAL